MPRLFLPDRFNTQPPEGGWFSTQKPPHCQTVSTHSRLKAAGVSDIRQNRFLIRFNTQPPEGGWPEFKNTIRVLSGFNTQPPEGGWKWSFRPF